MIHTIAFSKDMKLLEDLELDDLKADTIQWYWVDFDCPTEEESKLLDSFFNFHPLSIEDCLHHLQRPKIDYYEGYNFLVLHSLNENGLFAEELDLFISNNYLVSFHNTPLKEVWECRQKVAASPSQWHEGTIYIEYTILDKLVDNYFPACYEIEDSLDEFNEIERGKLNKDILNKVFEVRGKLLKLRRIINQMKDLLYRIINSKHIETHKGKHLYFHDVYDHLLRLSELIESSLLITSDMRESYVSMNSDRMNKIMMVFTAVTTIFVPLTFIVGVYGMNFDNMPELHWKYGYFTVLGLMALIGGVMLIWFKKKNWFDS